MADFEIRRLVSDDIEQAADVIITAFNDFNASVNLPPELPNKEVAYFFAKAIICNPNYYTIGALDKDGKLLGLTAAYHVDDVYGCGPFTIRTDQQKRRVGRTLIGRLLDHARELEKRSIRLVQVAANTASWSLYVSLGWDPKEALTFFEGFPVAELPGGFTVRPITAEDVDACDALFVACNSVSRRSEILDSVADRPFPVLLAEDARGKVVAYSTGLFLDGHAIATSEDALLALLLDAAQRHRDKGLPPLAFHVAARLQPSLARSLLKWKLRVVRNLTLMSMGDYQDPAEGYIYCPSIGY